MKTYTKEQLSEILENHKLWLNYDGGSRANLCGADLRGANLCGANLRDADLRYASLSDANLRDANLSDANLRYANLSDADLRDANLRDANLRDANLSDANLSDADLRDADLRDANLRDANLSDADLSYADLRYANLSDANLSDANLRDAVGNMNQLKSIFIETYPITYTSETLQIGCQKHKIEDWWDFDDEKIISMDGKTALKFWRKHKDLIKMTIELSPADPTKED